MERVVVDLCGSSTPSVSLFSLSPACVGRMGAIESAFLPNVEHSTERAFSLLRFVGKLMGLAMRNEVCA